MIHKGLSVQGDMFDRGIFELLFPLHQHIP